MNLITPSRIFQQAQTIKEVLNNVEVLFADIGIYPKWDEFGKSYNLPIIYDDYSTLLNISYYSNAIHFSIKTENKKLYCLGFNITISDNNRLHGSIGSVNKYATCMIPQIKTGTWLMNFVNSFLCFIGIREATLEDASRIKCGKYEADLLLLRVFSGNFYTWYENFGYVPDYYDDPNKKVLALTTMQTLYNFPAINIFTDKVQYKTYYYQDIEINISEIYHHYPPGTVLGDVEIPSLLGPYMTFLWKINCAYYAQIETYMQNTDGRWYPLLQILHNLSDHTNKNLC